MKFIKENKRKYNSWKKKREKRIEVFENKMKKNKEKDPISIILGK